MTTELQRLIDAVRTARAEYERDDLPTRRSLGERWDAEFKLIDYMLAHAAAFAERDRLERNVVNAWEHLKLDDIHPKEFDMEVDKLVDWLVSNAASDDPAARS